MASLTLDGNSLLYRTPYHAGLVADLKVRIPYAERRWEHSLKAWRVAAQYGGELVRLTQQHLHEVISAPVVTQIVPTIEQRLLEVRYIGMTKERGADHRTAFGWCEGAWSVIFPEPALRAWFDAPARPDEETTLYQVLSTARDVDPQALKSAYRRLARQWHPDVCRELGADEVFKRITTAYEILSAPPRRAKYDAGLALTASLQRQPQFGGDLFATGYRSPFRCGYILAEGVDQLGRFLVEKIIAWEDIVDAYGRILVTSWPVGGDMFVENWI